MDKAIYNIFLISSINIIDDIKGVIKNRLLLCPMLK